MIKVVLADDHELFRAGLRSILERAGDMEILLEAGSGEEAMEWPPGAQPDVILMDIDMPGMGGIEATRRIRRRHPETQVIALTAKCEAPYPRQLFDAGALGYLTKHTPAEEMFDAIRRVAKGKSYISQDVADKLRPVKANSADPNSPFANLSNREEQVMLMIIRGKRTQDIADHLFLSPKTVSTYRHRLYEKLAVETDVEMTYLALRHGLVEI